MTLYAHTDGASRGNPGESGIGIIIRDEHNAIVYEASGDIGKATNNIAEYTALLACLKKAHDLGCRRLVVYSDSQLMVRQMLGEYRVKDSTLQRYHRRAHDLLKSAQYVFEIIHIEREQNKDADKLANTGIDSKQNLAV